MNEIERRNPPALPPVDGAVYGRALEPAPAQSTLLGIWQTLRRHPWLIVIVAAAVTGIGAYSLLSAPPQYVATTTIRVANLRGQLTGSLGGNSSDQMMGRFTDPILSEVQVLMSRALARRVVEHAGLRLAPLTPEVPATLLQNVAITRDAARDTLTLTFGSQVYEVRSGERAVQQPYGLPVHLDGLHFTVPHRPAVETAVYELRPEADAIDFVLGGLRPAPREYTDVVDIHFTAGDPLLAQQIANAFATEFQAYSATRAQQQSRRRRAFLQGQLAATDSILQAAQNALSSFRSARRTYSASERFSAEEGRLASLTARQDELLAEQQTYHALLSRLDRNDYGALRGVMASPELASNPAIAGLYGQMVAYQTRRDSLTTGPWARSTRDAEIQRLDTLIENGRLQLINAVREQLGTLDARLRALDQIRSRNSDALIALPAQEAEELALTEQVESARSLAMQLREEYQRAGLSEAVETGNVEIIDLAESPGSPISRKLIPRLLILIMMGVGMGLGAAMLLERVNTTVRRREEVEMLVSAPVLSVVPPLSSRPNGSQPGVLGRALGRRSLGNGADRPPPEEIDPSAGEAFRMLRTGLLFSRSEDPIRTVLITSAAPSEGKSTASAHLALSYAQSGARTLLVDCDLRRPSQHRIFNVSRGPGLSELVLGLAERDECLRPGPVPHLFVLPCGRATPNPAEFATSPHVRAVLRELFSGYEFVVLDAPPALVASEAAILATLCDAVILVVRAGRTDRSSVQQAARQLAAVGARVTGVVLNDPDDKVSNYRYAEYYEETGAAAG